jgi:prepilin-type N-terminal cleavage/methylation domain-containing protein
MLNKPHSASTSRPQRGSARDPARDPARRRVQTRRAFTLVELLLVLALMVVLAAIAVPAMHGPMQNYKLRKAGDQVRTLFGKAQIRAIRSGQTQVLVFVPASGQVQIQTFYSDQDMVDASPQNVILGAPQTGTANPGAVTLMALDELLPEGVLFFNAQTKGEIRDLYAQQKNSDSAGVSAMTGGMADRDLLMQGGIPLMFYPDGTSSTAKVIITNDQDAFIVLNLRGLTGVAQVSDLLSANEL